MKRTIRLFAILALAGGLAFGSAGCSDNVYGSVSIGTSFGGPGGYGSISMGFPIR